MKLEIPFKTYAAIFFALIVGVLLFYLKFQILLLFIAMIIAITLYSGEIFLSRRGIEKKFSIPLIIILYVGLFIAVVFWIIPAVLGQMMDLTSHFSQIHEQIKSNQSAYVFEKNLIELLDGSPEILTSAKAWLASIGKQTLSGVLDIGILFVVSIYMFLDGPRTFKWIRARFKKPIQEKMNLTVKEIEPIMTAYVYGQVITSTLAAFFTYISARFLHIPAALTLAFLAAVFDMIPGIGLIMLVFSASILAMAVSLQAAIYISVILIFYHMLESYVLTPYIYGKRMKLSPLVVLISLILAGTVAGVMGMVAILPVVAAYTTIEKVWFNS